MLGISFALCLIGPSAALAGDVGVGRSMGDDIISGLHVLGETGFVVEDTEDIVVRSPANIIFGVIAVAVSTVGMLFFLLLLYSGYLWVTAYGEEDKAEKAMKVARRAVVGLGIVMAAYIITIAGFYYMSRIAGGKYYYPSGGTADWRDHETGYEEDIDWN